MDKSEGAGISTGAVFAQGAFYRAQQVSQYGTLQGDVALQKIPQALGHGEYPLAHWQPWKDVISQMRGRLGHAPRVARRTHAAPFAGESDEEVVAALVAVGTGKTVG